MNYFKVTPLHDHKIIFIKFLMEFDGHASASALQALYNRSPKYLEYRPIYDFRSYTGLLMLENLITPINILRNMREKIGLPRIHPGNKAFLWSDRQKLEDHQTRINEILENPNILSTTSDLQAWYWVSGQSGLPPKFKLQFWKNRRSAFSFTRDYIEQTP